MKLTHIFFYLSLLFLPTQLGKHFFPDYSFIRGIRVDYLSPVIYITDLLVITFISSAFLSGRIRFRNRTLVAFSAWCVFLLFANIAVSVDIPVALIKSVKITEMVLFGCVITVVKPDRRKSLIFLSLAVIFSSMLAVWQYVLQHTVGGIFWYVGERTFSASTPGIALAEVWGQSILRPYATFPHPNVLGGFLTLTVLEIALYLKTERKKINGIETVVFFFAFLIGMIGLALSFSRAAWLVFAFGAGMITYRRQVNSFLENKNAVLIVLYACILLSIAAPLIFRIPIRSLLERSDLMKAAVETTLSHPVWGAGLNNSIIRAYQPVKEMENLYFLQPVHNVFMLVMSETGMAGFSLLIFSLAFIVVKKVKNLDVFTLGFILLFFLALSDHYLFTLQQGLLLLTVTLSFLFLPREKRKNTV